MGVTLTVVAGPHRGRAFTFTEHATFLVGRSPDVHFSLPDDPYFSRVHFLIEVNPPLGRLQDLGSKNRTMVNEQTLAKCEAVDLQDGDTIRGGTTVFQIQFEPASDDVAPPATPGRGTLTWPGSALAAEQTADFLSELTARARALRGPELVAALLDDQERRWTAGQRVWAELYLERLPAVRADADAAVAVICGEASLRRHRGEAFARSEYRHRFPAWADAIDHQLRRQSEAGQFGRRLLDAVASSMASPTPPTVPAGRPVLPVIPGYRLERELGRGGMGVVYEAVADGDGARVAVKTILPARRPTPRDLEVFLREANVLKQLRHPNVVAFRDLGEANGLLYFAMEFVPGTDAATVLKREGPLAVGRAVRWAVQMLDGLAAAHRLGFVHRDVKPSNLLVTPGPDGEVVKLADFGLAKAYQKSRMSGLTMTGSVGGTPAFMPPEQVLDFRSAKPAADQYAAAATLYNLLTGAHVYDKAPTLAETFQRILTTEPVPLRSRRPDVPTALAATIERALRRLVELRFPALEELRRALVPFAAAD